jgi:type IV pilus assembly protein PilC
MATFIYQAMNKKGQEIKGELDAASHEQAIQIIQKKGLYPTNVKRKSDRGFKRAATTTIIKIKKRTGLSLSGKASQKDLTNFTRQLSTLLDAGLPLVRSLQILEKQMKSGVMKDAIAGLIDDIQGGSNLSEALSKYENVFDKLYINMIKAGEAGGILDLILNRLSEFMEKSQKIKKQVIGALVYPVTVSCIAVGILMLIMVFIIPKFEKMFKDSGQELPAPTLALQAMSNFLIGGGWILVLCLPIVFLFAIKMIQKSEAGRLILDRYILKIPLFGSIIKMSTISRFCRTLGTLQQSGVPLLEALSIVKEATGNSVVEKAISDVHNSIREGDTIAEPLEMSGLFDPIVVNMVEVGEETGELDKMLIKVADNYDSDVETLISSLMSAFEPILIIGMGLTVGGIVVALFLPMVNMMQGMGG